jgi:myosin-5
VRRSFRSDVKHVIYLQSCVRRRLARRELRALKAEARSVSKFKEISYKLENKVVELTQNLQKRTEEKKEIQVRLSELEQQLQQWITRHEESDTRAKQFQASLQSVGAELRERDERLLAKADVEKRLEDSVAKSTEKEETIRKLTADLLRQTEKLEAQQKALNAVPPRNTEDSSVIMTLKNEVSSLREQLNRANALNALTKGGRMDPPVSPTFAPTLKLSDLNGMSNGAATGGVGGRHQRRHSSAGVFAASYTESRASTDEMMFDVRRGMNPRAVSVAYNGEDNYLRYRNQGLPDIRDTDDPAEEKIRLMQDVKRLDEDVLDGLIRGLKIPAPSLTNPSPVKEILFPANLISLVTNEMWKYGLISESERFLANVMQVIQAHVMVNAISKSLELSLLTSPPCSPSLEKMPLFPGYSGYRMSTKCSHSSASPKATCCKASGLGKKTQSDLLTGTITSVWYPSSSTTWTASSTTFIIRGCWRRRRDSQRWLFLP